MPDENRVFDVTKPKHVSPSATSKPVIVGHQPTVSDPMVRESEPVREKTAEPTRIMINNDGEMNTEPSTSHETLNHQSPTFDAPAIIKPEEPVETIPHYEGPAVMPLAEAPASEEPREPDFKPLDDEPIPAHPTDDNPVDEPESPDSHSHAHIEGLHLDSPKKKNRLPLYALVTAVLLALVYLGLDAGGVNVPFHVIKHHKPAATTTNNTTSNNQTPSTATTLPTGFKEYKLADTSITFAAPLAWGDPTSTLDPGYSKRGGTNQSDGTYAYLVNFSTNKDVQVAVTSNKYLPAARSTLYYDYLQWCTGTNDGKYYESILRFTTTDKVDVPSTISCDQGPVAGALKLDDSTIVQVKATDTQNKIAGDIYTKNLKDPSLVVFRIKDNVMTNGDQIKQLLNTVKSSAAS
jgi:hypothetical protein